MNENYLKYKYYTSRCEMADEYKKITGEELQPLGEDWENYKKGDFKMNIEEAIDILVPKENIDLSNHFNNTRFFEAINTLLTAYEKEKEKNKELKWKPIKDYNKKKYDWVLVKYFDGDYECVPEVAEKRSDGKWYTSEKQIPFEVKYFFDMQEILKEE